jgi:hypothetical protein
VLIEKQQNLILKNVVVVAVVVVVVVVVVIVVVDVLDDVVNLVRENVRNVARGLYHKTFYGRYEFQTLLSQTDSDCH